MNDKNWTGLIQSIYTTVADASGWQKVLSELCRNLSAQQAVLWRKDTVRGQVTAHHSHNVEARYREQYRDHFHRVDVRAQALESKAPEFGYASQTIFPDREYLKSEIYNDFCKPQDTRHTLEASLLPAGSAQQIHLGLHRGHGMQGFGPDEVATVNKLLAHIKQSLQLADTLTNGRDENSALQTAINHLSEAVAVCSHDAHTLHLNSAFSQLLERRGLVSVNRTGRILFVDSKNQLQFDALRSDCLGLPRSNREPGELRSVLMAGKKHRYMVRLAPWLPPASGTWGVIGAPGFFLFIREIIERQAPFAPDLVEAHALTPSEAHIGEMLCRGMLPAEIAEQRGVAQSTVRQQIKTMMRKLCCHSRAELVAMLLKRL